MPVHDRGSRERMESGRTSSFPSSARAMENVVRTTGRSLERLYQLVMTRVCCDEDVELAETIADELKPLIDSLIHFEVPHGDA